MMIEPVQITAGSSSSGSRHLSKKSSSRNLNIVAPTGARPKLSRSVTLANHHAPPPRYTSKPTKSGQGRGLTLRIDSSLPVQRSSNGNSNFHSLRSAPARSVRRLPAVPGGSARNSPSDAEAGAGPFQSVPATPFTAPVGHFGERSRARRSVRPLPCLPTQVQQQQQERDSTVTPISTSPSTSTSRSGSITPTTSPTLTARPRSVKPLPVPVVKAEPFVLSQVASPAVVELLSLSSVQSTATHSTPPVSEVNLSTPLPAVSQESTVSDVQVSQEVVHNADDGSAARDPDWDVDADWDEEDEEYMDDLEEGVIQLGNRIVLRKISNVSLDSDFTSDEDEEELKEPSSEIPVQMRMPALKKKDTSMGGQQGEEDEYMDYSWVLSNRMLYRQQCDAQVVSKWMLERKGKRYTEQDYENIIQALRTL